MREYGRIRLYSLGQSRCEYVRFPAARGETLQHGETVAFRAAVARQIRANQTDFHAASALRFSCRRARRL